MAAIIYEKTPGALIPQGNRTVSTFPSGLVRVDQSFIGRTSDQIFHRQSLAVGSDFPGDSYPSYDGLKIYPEVQEKRMSDGFTEYLVSAYGRSSPNPSNLRNNYRRIILNGFMTGFRASFLETKGTVVIPSTESFRFENSNLQGEYYPVQPINIYNQSEYMIDSSIFGFVEVADSSGNTYNIQRYRNYVFAAIEPSYGASFITTDPYIITLETRNFGFFNEIDFITSIDPNGVSQTGVGEGVSFDFGFLGFS